MTTTTTHAGIRAANERLMAAFSAGDAAAVAACYTTGGLLMPPRTESIEGRAGTQAYWQAAMDMGLTTLQVETLELLDFGAHAVEIGRYSLAAGEGQIVDHGKYIVVWEQEDSEWRLARDIWNSNVPLAGA